MKIGHAQPLSGPNTPVLARLQGNAPRGGRNQSTDGIEPLVLLHELHVGSLAGWLAWLASWLAAFLAGSRCPSACLACFLAKWLSASLQSPKLLTPPKNLRNVESWDPGLGGSWGAWARPGRKSAQMASKWLLLPMPLSGGQSLGNLVS